MALAVPLLNLKNNILDTIHTLMLDLSKVQNACADILRLPEGQDAYTYPWMKIIVHIAAEATEHLHVYSICLFLQPHYGVRQ